MSRTGSDVHKQQLSQPTTPSMKTKPALTPLARLVPSSPMLSAISSTANTPLSTQRSKQDTSRSTPLLENIDTVDVKKDLEGDYVKNDDDTVAANTNDDAVANDDDANVDTNSDTHELPNEQVVSLSRNPSLKLESTISDDALHYNIGHHSGTSGITLPDGLRHRRLSKHLHHLDHGIDAEIKHKMVLSTEDKLLGLPGNLALSSAQSGTYFGTEGRARFFERSKWAHRQRQNTTLSSNEPVKKVYSDFTSTNLNDDVAFGSPSRGPSSGNTNRQLDRFHYQSNDDGDAEADAKKLYLKEISNLELGSDEVAYDADDVLEALQDNDEDENDLDSLSLTSLMLEAGQDITEVPSPRTNFIMSCLKEKRNPMASLIVRKKLSKIMNLNHYGFGNDMAILIAESLSGLPFLQSINMADNNLNDSGLIPLMKAISCIPTLLHLDLSLNNIGMDASILLGEFLESKYCALEKLRVKNANLDDFKCEKFIPKLTDNKSLKEIDLSSNTIGAAENLKNKKYGNELNFECLNVDTKNKN